MHDIKPFLISGLPRSRTAWLSVFFSHFPSQCMHEGLAKFGGDLTRMVGEMSEFVSPIGDSDSALTLHADEVIKAAADGKVRLAVIDRDVASVYKSLSHFLEGSGYDATTVLGHAYEGHKKILNSEHAHIVKFADLEDEQTVRDLHAFLLPNVEFPLSWYRQMRLLRVNQIFDKAVSAQTGGNS